MRVAVVTSSPPMVEGGHMVIARALVQALQAAGHQADIVVTPQNRFGRQASAYLANWLTDVETSDGKPIDHVISLRYPSYAVRHHRHVCWLNHTMREYYDLWDRFSATLSPKGLVKERVRRRLMHAADRYLLTKNVTRLFVQSKTIQERLQMWPELQSTVLYPPPPPRPYRCDDYGDYIFMVSRLTPLKRADLLIEALATSRAAGIKAVIGGEGEERVRLEARNRRATDSPTASRLPGRSATRPYSITSRAAVPCAFLQCPKTTASSRPRHSPRTRRSSPAAIAAAPRNLSATASTG